MPEPLIPPEFQYCDANGAPYAGGTVNTFIPGTDTPKDTWSDLAGTALNTNPIVLDAAGRALIYGSGEYRFVLKDAAGNLIYDQLTTSFVSDAMQPVVMADTIAEARDLLGITDAIQAETDRAEAAEGALGTEITAETTRAEAAEATLTANLNAEIARAEAAEAALQTTVNGMQTSRAGTATTDSSGMAFVTFSPAFTSYCSAMVACGIGPQWLNEVSCASVTTTGGTIYCIGDTAGGTVPGVGIGVMWIAVGY